MGLCGALLMVGQVHPRPLTAVVCAVKSEKNMQKTSLATCCKVGPQAYVDL